MLDRFVVKINSVEFSIIEYKLKNFFYVNISTKNNKIKRYIFFL